MTGQGWFDAGAQANFQITPTVVSGDAGTQYVFTSWSGTGNGSYSGSNTTQTIFMNGAVAETANWQVQYQISLAVNPVGSGTVTPSGTNIWMNGGELAISANPTSDFSFSSWSTTGSITINQQLTNAATVNIYGPGAITANFIYQPGTTSTPTPSPSPHLNSKPTSTPTPSPTAHPSPLQPRTQIHHPPQQTNKPKEQPPRQSAKSLQLHFPLQYPPQQLWRRSKQTANQLT